APRARPAPQAHRRKHRIEPYGQALSPLAATVRQEDRSPTEQEQAGAWWTESGPPLPPTAEVALAVDAQGTLVAATLDPVTSTLRVTRRKEEAGLALEGWREV
ncbi:hypothetical protein ABZW51_22135, partial [Streptomyces cellulosae]